MSAQPLTHPAHAVAEDGGGGDAMEGARYEGTGSGSMMRFGRAFHGTGSLTIVRTPMARLLGKTRA